MTRGALNLDRLVVLVIGVALVVAGIAGIAWWAGWFPGDPGSVHATGLVTSTRRPWWPWAVGAAGVIGALLALRWLLAHVPRHGVKQLTLPGSGDQGRLDVSTSAVTDAACEELGATRGVRSATSHTRTDRGQLVAVFDVTVEQGADLAAVAAAADSVAGQLRSVLGRDDLSCRINLKPASHGRTLSRAQ